MIARRTPEIVIIIEEPQLAHKKVLETIIYPILDQGEIKDSKGNTVYFDRAILLFPTNAGQQYTSLDREKLLKGAGALAATAAKIAPEIPKMAASPQNWGMAKSFMMDAVASGYNPSKQGDLNAYMHDYNARLSKDFAPEKLSQPDPFRKYNGSNLVKVKYPDGSVVKCKFSKVEADLRAGRCSIVKKK